MSCGWRKSRYDTYAVPAATIAVDELAGLSCRWSPIPSRKSCIVSLLVLARSDDTQAVFGELIHEFSKVLGQSLDDANPVALEHVRYKSFWSALRDEYTYHRTVFSVGFFKRCIEILLAILIFRHGINVAKNSFDNKHYVDNLRYHSDYRKFDDTLRLVLDCTDAQAQGLENVLLRAKAARFIDGGDGGLAMAARQLKAQVSAEARQNV